MGVFCYAQNSYAQAEALSQKEFSRKYLPDPSSVFGGDSPKVMCGKRENLCDTNSQICLRCTRKKFGKFLGIQVSTNIKDDGKCVSKSSVNIENLLASWPDCVADKGGTADITVSPNGFVSETERRVLGIGKKHKEEYESADGKKYMLYADGSNMTIAYGNKGFKGWRNFGIQHK